MARKIGTERIRVFVVHPQVLFRESLSRVLAAMAGIAIAGCSDRLAEGLEALRQSAAQVLLADLGSVAAAAGLFHGPEKTAGRMLALADRFDPAATLDALNAGFAGIFFTDGALESLAQAIRMVASGSAWLDQRILAMLADRGALLLHPPRGPETVPAREEQVLDAVCEGLTNRAIAVKLGISESLVKSLLRQLFQKAGVHARSQLVRTYLQGAFRANLPG